MPLPKLNNGSQDLLVTCSDVPAIRRGRLPSPEPTCRVETSSAECLMRKQPLHFVWEKPWVSRARSKRTPDPSPALSRSKVSTMSRSL